MINVIAGKVGKLGGGVAVLVLVLVLVSACTEMPVDKFFTWYRKNIQGRKV